MDYNEYRERLLAARPDVRGVPLTLRENTIRHFYEKDYPPKVEPIIKEPENTVNDEPIRTTKKNKRDKTG